jgi:aconitate hydratase
MPDNLTTRILREHLVSGTLVPGNEIEFRVDMALLQDATGTMACMQFEQLGLDRIRIPLAVQFVDHNILAIDFKNPDDHRFLQTFCARYGIHYSKPGNGISHYIMLERFDRPGAVLIGADSHTTTAGAMSMIAVGAGGLDVAVAMAGHPFALEAPRVVGVELQNRLPDWVEPKDVILELLRRRGVRGGLGRFFEFFGPGVATLSTTDRATIANMIAELGATGAVFPSDERTLEWLRYQAREQDYIPLSAEPHATYEEYETIDLAKLEPLIAKPQSPGNVVPVRELEGTKAAQVCVGSSVNSSYRDLATVAAVLKDKLVHPDLVMTVTPGSRQILDTIVRAGVYRDLVAAGARMLEPACGPCVGMGQAPPSDAVSVRTFNRNFPGRSGTENDRVYLCSPATAAATALRGVITDPRRLGKPPAFAAPEANPAIDDRQIISPVPPENAAAIEIIRGPNIVAPPEQRPLEEELAGRVLIVVPDDVATGEMAPDGAIVMAFRSNIPAIAEFTFQHRDPGFVRRAKDWGGGLIVAGHNYGQGSSREHAALAPLQLGVRAVIAKSFARIHRRNLIGQGILPLAFLDDKDYEEAELGQSWEIPAIRRALVEGRDQLQVSVAEADRKFTVGAAFSQSERDVLLAGGVLRHLREGGIGLANIDVVSGAAEV